MCVCSSVFAHEGGSRLVYLSVIKWFGGVYIQEALHLHIYILITVHFIMMNLIYKNVCTTRGN